MTKNEEELERILNLYKIERKLHNKDYKYIAGVDEAGRGPLAGPVVAGAVILAVDTPIEDLKDSKLLSEKKRDKVCNAIKDAAIAYSYKAINKDFIDEHNILNATLFAMKGAIEKLDIRPDLVLVDALEIPGLDIEQFAIKKGDRLCACIAAASIIAKVKRDELMKKYDKIFPNYRFGKNKGYPTREHINLIQKYGRCPIHRQSFKVKGLDR